MSQTQSNVFVLSRINKALRADFRHLTEADAELQSMLEDARAFGERAMPAGSNDARWKSEWETIASLLSEIRLYTLKMREEMEADASSPLAAFDVVIARDARLHEALEAVAIHLDRTLVGESRADWDDLWSSLQSQLDVIQAYLAAARARIETRRKHGTPESERVREEILSLLPADSSLEDPERFAEEYEKAFQQFQRDKHRTGGLVDVFKALLLIQEEGPEAKIRRRLHESSDI